ncbi:hypothetical protein V6Z11_A10G000100 [Gossypium hirsutum]
MLLLYSGVNRSVFCHKGTRFEAKLCACLGKHGYQLRQPALGNRRPKKKAHTLHRFSWFLKSTASSGTDFEWVHFSAVSLLRFL